MNRELAHVLTVRPDRDDFAFELQCAYDLEITPSSDVQTPFCRSFTECDCKLTDEQYDDFACDGEGPCPTSPNGRHYVLNGGGCPWRPTDNCAAVYDDYSDDSYMIARAHGAGVYAVSVWWEDEEYLRLTPLARLSYLHKRLGGVEPLDFSEVAS